MMTDFTIHIDAPELAQAIQALAGVLGKKQGATQKQETSPAVQAPVYNHQPVQSPTTQTATPAAPVRGPVPGAVLPTSAAAPVSAAPAAATPVAQTAPVAAAPQYTPEMIQLATAPLIDAGKGEQLKGLLSKYGVMRVSDIPMNALGAFATDLRALGARI